MIATYIMHNPHHQIGLFGAYRWLLAIMVVIAHFGPEYMNYTGNHAVFGFFALSGYLMALVLEKKYFLLPGGVTKYYKNRFLRIYPLYLIIVSMSLLVIYGFPELSTYTPNKFIAPPTLKELIANITIIGLINPIGTMQDSLLIFPAWSLSIEIGFWIILPLLLKKPDFFWGWIILSLLFAAIGYVDNFYNAQYRYFSPLGWSIVFCAGVGMFYLRDTKHYTLPHSIGGISILLWLGWHFFAHLIYPDPWLEGLVTGLLLNCTVIYYIGGIHRGTLPGALIRLDNILGHVSYPIFLVHMLVGVGLYALLDRAYEPNIVICIAVIVLSHIAGYALYCLIDRRIQNIRTRTASSTN